MFCNQKHDKDCLQATLANLLHMRYKDIPEFYKYYTDDNLVFEKKFNSWLSNLGYCWIIVNIFHWRDGAVKIPFYCGQKNFRCIGVLKKKNGKDCHAVLLKLNKIKSESFKIDILHDPMKQKVFDLKDLVSIELIIKI
jgi:hypothetical protein